VILWTCWKPGSGQRREDNCHDNNFVSNRRRLLCLERSSPTPQQQARLHPFWALVCRCVCSPCLVAWWHVGAELCGLSLNPRPTGNQVVSRFCYRVASRSGALIRRHNQSSPLPRPAFPSASASPRESTNSVSMNGTTAAGTPNSSWRPIKSNSGARQGRPAARLRLPCGRPDLPDRCPQPMTCQRPHSQCKTPPAAAGIRPHRCTINMYLICMCWLRRVGIAKTGRERGGSRIQEPRKPLPSTRRSGSSGESWVSLALRYRWE